MNTSRSKPTKEKHCVQNFCLCSFQYRFKFLLFWMPMDILRSSFKKQQFTCWWYIAKVHFLQSELWFPLAQFLWELRLNMKLLISWKMMLSHQNSGRKKIWKKMSLHCYACCRGRMAQKSGLPFSQEITWSLEDILDVHSREFSCQRIVPPQIELVPRVLLSLRLSSWSLFYNKSVFMLTRQRNQKAEIMHTLGLV